MKILIVAATKGELEQLFPAMGLPDSQTLKWDSHEARVLVTGAGMTATAFHLGRELQRGYDAALNLGLAGSFFRDIKPGTVVHVTKDLFSEAGAQNGDAFIPLPELGLEGPFEILNMRPWQNPVVEKLPQVHGITVNTVHGHEPSIDEVFARFSPFVESMEGAAFLYACREYGIPCAQVRAISNYVEKRNREKWEIPLAVRSLGLKAAEILKAAGA